MGERDRRAATRSAATARPRIRASAEICTVTHAASRKNGRTRCINAKSIGKLRSIGSQPARTIAGPGYGMSADVAADPLHRDFLVGAVGHDLVESLLHRCLQFRIVLADGDADGDAAAFDVRRIEL